MFFRTVLLLALVAAFSDSVSAQLTRWYLPSNQTKSGIEAGLLAQGITRNAEVAYSLTSAEWKDTFVTHDVDAPAPDSTYLSLAGASQTGQLRTWVVVSFNAIFSSLGAVNRSGYVQITPADPIGNAELWLNVTAVSNPDQLLSAHVWGLPIADANWTESQATWLHKSTSVAWSGGSIWDSRGTDYGAIAETPSVSAGDPAKWYNLNLTQAIQDYRDGLIGGLIIGTDAAPTPARRAVNFRSAQGYDEALDPFSDPAAFYVRPGLYVTTPEPVATGALILSLGATIGIYWRKRAQ